MNVIQPFKRRLIIEAIVKSVLFGLLTFVLAMIGVAATYIIWHKVLIIFIGALLSIALGIVVSIPVFICALRKRLKSIKYRLDSLGLEERVITMAEFRHDKSYVAQMQREDTMSKLAALPVRTLKIKKSKILITAIACLLVILMTMFICATPIHAAMVLLSENNNSSSTSTTEPPEEQETLEDKIEEDFQEIEDIIDESDMNEEDKEEIKKELDDIKDQVDNILKDENKTEEEKKEEINDIIKDYQNQLDKEQESENKSNNQIAENLKDNDLKNSEDPKEKEMGEALENLGQAIEDLNKADTEEGKEAAADKVQDALDKLENIINGKDPETSEEKDNLTDEKKQENADKVANEIYNSIATVPNSTMKDTFKDLADNLDNATQNSEDKNSDDDPNNNTTVEEEINNSFEDVSSGIKDSIEKTDTKEEISDSMTDMREDLVGSDQVEFDDMLDDIEDKINNSDLKPSTKDEAHDILDDLNQKVDDMIKNNASNSEISAEIQEAKDKIDSIIQKNQNSYADEFKPNEGETSEEDEWWNNTDTEEAIKDANDAIQDANNAIQKENNGEIADSTEGIENTKDKVVSAFDQLEDQLKSETGEWLKGEGLKEQLGDMAQDFRDTANSMPDGEAKDIWNDLADAFEQAKDQAAAGNEQEAIDTATGALKDAEQKFQNAIGKLEDLKGTQDEVSDRFEEGQSNIMGYPTGKPEDSSQNDNKNESEEGSSGKNEEDKEPSNDNTEGDGNNNEINPDKPSGDGGNSSEQDKSEDKIFVPGIGQVTVEDLINSGILEDEYDKQFERELTDEERDAIENYFASLRQE